jgi:hypothetical protein
MTVIKIKMPGKDQPGYFRRQRMANELSEEMRKGEAKADTTDKFVKYILQFVIEPKDRKEAEEALWDASEAQVDEILEAMRGNKEPNPTK